MSYEETAHRVPTLFLAVSALLFSSSASVAQTPAKANVRVGCTVPGPPDSLLPGEASPTVYLAKSNGNFIIEFEDLPPTGGWVAETALPPFTGDSYFRWDGPNLFNTPGVGVLEYDLQFDEALTYEIRLRVRHDHPQSDQENDCWMRIDNGPWEKIFSNFGGLEIGVWNYHVKLESTNQEPTHFFSEGLHTIAFSGRSHNFKIDRLSVYPVGNFGQNDATPPTPKLTSLPIINTNFTIAMDDPTNAAGMNPSTTSALVVLSPNAAPGWPCGQVLPGIGELLISLSESVSTSFQPWSGPGQPTLTTIPVPSLAILVGQKVFAQGVFVDVDPASPALVLTDGLNLTVGDTN